MILIFPIYYFCCDGGVYRSFGLRVMVVVFREASACGFGKMEFNNASKAIGDGQRSNAIRLVSQSVYYIPYTVVTRGFVI